MFKVFILFSVVLSAGTQQIKTEPEPPPHLPYHTLPVYGNASLGYYYVKIFVGGPEQQPQSVIVDTGSGILAFPCTKCKSCSSQHIDPPYDPAKSQFSKELTCASDNQYCRSECKGQSETSLCPFSIFYAQGSSLQGVMIEDNVAFENYSKGEEIRTYFGCTTKETNLFLSQEANGIFGLAPNRESDLLDKLVAKHSKFSGEILQFSLCLSSNGGLMTVGGINKDLHPDDEPPTFTVKYSKHKNLYSLQDVFEVRVGTNVLHWGAKNYGMYGIFIDSGSTFTYFPRDVYSKFLDFLNKKCEDSQVCKIGKGEDSQCYHISTDGRPLIEMTNEIFPPLYFQINQKDLSWPSTKYMLIRDVEKKEVCLGVLQLDRYLLGANWMYDRDIVFDIKDSEVRIYDNTKCLKESPEMGQYTKLQSGNPSLDYRISFTGNLPTSTVLFIIGIVFSVLAFLLLILLLVCKEDGGSELKKASQKIDTVNTERGLLMRGAEEENIENTEQNTKN